MNKLDEIRAEIIVRRDRWAQESGIALQNHAIAVAELEAHDRAVALFAPQPAPERAARRNIAKRVLAALTDEPQTVARIAEKIGVPPSRVLRTLTRLGIDRDAERRVVRPSHDHLRQLMDESEIRRSEP